MTTTPQIIWPLPDGAGLHEPDAPAANDNRNPHHRSGESAGRAKAQVRLFGRTPASPPAPAGGDQGFPPPWSPPSFIAAWQCAGAAP